MGVSGGQSWDEGEVGGEAWSPDDRVVPGHSFKFAAALQYAQSSNAPTLIRIETRAGHGAGTPTSKRIEQAADAWAFLVDNLGMKVK